jgi:hypothetical protein
MSTGAHFAATILADLALCRSGVATSTFSRQTQSKMAETVYAERSNGISHLPPSQNEN